MYVIDFDATIFDSKKFKYDLFMIWWKKNFEKYKKNYEIIKMEHKQFIPDKWSKLCNISYWTVINKLQNLSKYIFSDFIEFTKRSDKKIIILTYWMKELQTIKIQNSRVCDIIDNYIITDDITKKSDLKKIYKRYKEKIIYIDDKVFVWKDDFDFEIDIYKMDRFWNNWDISSFERFIT